MQVSYIVAHALGALYTFEILGDSNIAYSAKEHRQC